MSRVDSTKIDLRVPNDVLTAIDARAAAIGSSRSEVIREALTFAAAARRDGAALGAGALRRNAFAARRCTSNYHPSADDDFGSASPLKEPMGRWRAPAVVDKAHTSDGTSPSDC